MKLFAVVLLAASAWSQTIDGAWSGTLTTPAGKLRLRVNVKTTDGKLTGTLDSLDQGALGIPISEISFAERELVWKIASIRASYRGKLNASGDAFEGTFTQGADLKLDLTRGTSATAAAPANRPQTPKPPFPYRVEEVTFSSAADVVTLAGTLTIPEGKGPFPAVALISGSGPQDRDETILSHKPFAVIADSLTRLGVAVLRFDDRGTAKSTGTFKGATSADFARDVEGAMNFLTQRRDVNIKRIGLAGHSEGGLIAPMVAARRRDVAFVVLLAGPGVTGDRTLIRQAEAIMRASGAADPAIAANRALQEKLIAAMMSDRSSEDLEKQFSEEMKSPQAGKTMAAQATDPWMRYFVKYDPVPALARLQCPVLVMNGELDLQVLADQQVPAIEAALKQAKNKRVTIERIPGVNHLFQTAKLGTPGEYGEIEETFAPAALERLGAWFKRWVIR